MGTKRYLAQPVAEIVSGLSGRGRVIDLFCGTGAVTAELAGIASVVMNDVNGFLGPLLRATFTAERREAPHRIVEAIRPRFLRHRSKLESEFGDRLQTEASALVGGRAALLDYMEHAPHVGTSPSSTTSPVGHRAVAETAGTA